MDDSFVGQRRFVGHQKKNHFGIIIMCIKYKMSKASCVSRLLYENTRSLRFRLSYGNCCGDGSCGYGHGDYGDGNYGCGDCGCGWGISSIIAYNLAEFNSGFSTIVSSTPLRSSLSCSCVEIKHV